MAPRWRTFEKALKTKNHQINQLKIEQKNKPLSIKIDLINLYINQIINFSKQPHNIEHKLSCLKLIRELNELKSNLYHQK